MGFVDIAKAYDSVDRGKMFKTLEELGIGPKFIQTVKSMYTGDYIINEQHGEKTRPLYLGRGLRQVGFHFLVGLPSVITSCLGMFVESTFVCSVHPGNGPGAVQYTVWSQIKGCVHLMSFLRGQPGHFSDFKE